MKRLKLTEKAGMLEFLASATMTTALALFIAVAPAPVKADDSHCTSGLLGCNWLFQNCSVRPGESLPGDCSCECTCSWATQSYSCGKNCWI